MPIIRYSVFASKNSTVEIVNSFGTDKIAITVNELCKRTSNAVIEAVWSTAWSYKAPSTDTGEIGHPYFGIVIDDTNEK